MTLSRSELLRDTLDMLVLKTLTLAPEHGWGLSQRIAQLSGDVFEVNQGSLYPALQRLKRKGWVKSKWGTTENKRRAVYYTISGAGLKQLEKEEAQWKESAAAVERVLRLVLAGGLADVLALRFV